MMGVKKKHPSEGMTVKRVASLEFLTDASSGSDSEQEWTIPHRPLLEAAQRNISADDGSTSREELCSTGRSAREQESSLEETSQEQQVTTENRVSVPTIVRDPGLSDPRIDGTCSSPKRIEESLLSATRACAEDQSILTDEAVPSSHVDGQDLSSVQDRSLVESTSIGGIENLRQESLSRTGRASSLDQPGSDPSSGHSKTAGSISPTVSVDPPARVASSVCSREKVSSRKSVDIPEHEEASSEIHQAAFSKKVSDRFRQEPGLLTDSPRSVAAATPVVDPLELQLPNLSIFQVSRIANEFNAADQTTHTAVSRRIKDAQGRQGLYTGHFYRNTELPHGYGRMVYEDADEWYEGCFHFGQRNGYARHYLNEGDFYEGIFCMNRKHGPGTLKFSDGRIFRGIFSKGEMKQGTMTLVDGSSYRGSFANGRYNGQGVFRRADGAFYKGEFRNGKVWV